MHREYKLKGKVLITGGGGFIGRAIMAAARDENWDCEFTIYSRDEQKQDMARQMFGKDRVHCVLGDVRDTARLHIVAYGHDLVIHAAALKYIPEAEFNATECMEVNVLGSRSVITACRDVVPHVVALSTDKACQPLNVYGATKMMMERLFCEAQSYTHDTHYHVVRYGNVIGSTGSIIPKLCEQAQTGTLKLTDPDMTRFWLSHDQAIDLIVYAADDDSSEPSIIIPRAKSMSLCDLAYTISPNSLHEYTGYRPGEKKHESLMSAYESLKTQDMLHPLFMHYHPLTDIVYTTHPCDLSSDTADSWDEDDMLAAIRASELV